MPAFCDLAKDVATGAVSSTALTEQALDRLSEGGSRLSALAFLNVGQAKKAARDADALALQQGERALQAQPLLGIPMTVKEGLKVAGAPWNMGSTLHRERIADSDGSVVSRLREAGAVIAGLGAMAEMALWPETINRLTGRACHPADLLRTPGGSSGGDAALVAAGAVSIAIGADGGGSVRIPAAYCGLFGHKPSAGMVPLHAHVPMDGGPGAPAAALARYFTPGPMCRSARDLWPVLSAIAGADGIQQDMDAPTPRHLPPPSVGLLEGRDVFVLPAPRIRGSEPCDKAQIAAIHHAAEVMEAQGARLRSVREDLLVDAFWIWMGTLRCSADMDMERLVGGGHRVRLLPEMGAQLLGRGSHTTAGFLIALSSRIDPTGTRFWRKWEQRGQELKAELDELLGGGALLLCPAVPGPAPRHNHAYLHPFNIAACAVFNALGNPASVAPVFIGPEGLPRAAQIVAAHGADHLTVSAALSFQL